MRNQTYAKQTGLVIPVIVVSAQEISQGVKGLSVNVDRRTSSVTRRAQIFANGVRFRKNFVFTDEGRALAVAWIEETREKIHGEFTNHG